MKAFGKKLFLIPSVSRTRGMIFVPEDFASGTPMCRVASRGEKVNQFIDRNDVVLCPNSFSDRKNLTYKGGFFCDENHVFAVIKNNKTFPLGRRVLIERHIQEKNEGGIIIPENRRYQSLEGTVIRLGLNQKHFRVNDISPGDEIVLTGWKLDMVEVSLPDGKFGLIVNENDILYKKCNS